MMDSISKKLFLMFLRKNIRILLFAAIGIVFFTGYQTLNAADTVVMVRDSARRKRQRSGESDSFLSLKSSRNFFAEDAIKSIVFNIDSWSDKDIKEAHDALTRKGLEITTEIISLAFMVLGSQGDKCSADKVQKAYRKLALKYHPDKAGGNKIGFQLVSAAYDIVKDARQIDDVGACFDAYAKFAADARWSSRMSKNSRDLAGNKARFAEMRAKRCAEAEERLSEMRAKAEAAARAAEQAEARELARLKQLKEAANQARAEEQEAEAAAAEAEVQAARAESAKQEAARLLELAQLRAKEKAESEAQWAAEEEDRRKEEAEIERARDLAEMRAERAAIKAMLAAELKRQSEVRDARAAESRAAQEAEDEAQAAAAKAFVAGEVQAQAGRATGSASPEDNGWGCSIQ